MSEDNVTESALDSLKSRADVLGIKYHPNIGEDKLREKIEEAMGATNDEETKPEAEETEGAKRRRLIKEASELVRVRVTCMDPNRKEYDGDIFCAGNRITGTFKKYVPFDTEWHVPRIILKMIKRKQCQVFVSKRDDRGRPVREGKLINAFNVEELPPLTEEELKKLAQRQAMAAGTAAA
ncbi:hypothetical protein [uncultured Marinobacter sp.]|uniref:hypothetical protein n=1 Tax=uncultured Marinobacter sp. TaxID=187379 RepID=UPI002598FD31|nr:hypothetical protein [uncultured Marinobacter sp.]